MGAELKSWTINRLQLLWQGDEKHWRRSAPVLFPVVGQCCGGTIAIGGRRYPMNLHGFASSCRFRIAARSKNMVTFRLSDTPDTRRCYPFAFEFSVTYRIDRRCIAVDFDVANTGDGSMPYAVGFHPGFSWPGRATDAAGKVVFDREEQPHVPAITTDNLFATRRRPIELDGCILELTNDNLDSGALCFLNARSKNVTFQPTDRPAIRVDNQGFPHIAIWTKSGAPFLSIESWTGHGDPDGFDGEFFDKPSMRILVPGARERHRVRIGCGATDHG